EIWREKYKIASGETKVNSENWGKSEFPKWLRVMEIDLRDGLCDTLRPNSRWVNSGHRVNPREIIIFNPKNTFFLHSSTILRVKTPIPPSPSTCHSSNLRNFFKFSSNSSSK
ncbi:hypothetical protein HAX54_029845, partial [Datura stramonium]|nr:hypothetical protein [Datura stramonium]